VFVWIITKERCRSVDGILIGNWTGGVFPQSLLLRERASFAGLQLDSWLLGPLLCGFFFPLQRFFLILQQHPPRKRQDSRRLWSVFPFDTAAESVASYETTTLLV
jgi:hypothetical protein